MTQRDAPSEQSEDDGESRLKIVSNYGTRVTSFVAERPILSGAGVVFSVLLWVFRPYVQPIYYAIFFEYIGTTIYTVITTVVGFTSWKLLGREDSKMKVGGSVLAIATVILFGITLFSAYFAGVYVAEDMSATTVNNTEAKNLSSAPSVDNQNIRMMTFKGAETQAQTSFNNPTHTLSGGELVKRDSALTVSYAQKPEGIYKSFTRKQAGAVFVTINSTEPEVEAVNQKFKCGRGMLIFDDVKFQIQKNNMNTKLVNPTTFQGPSGELYNMYSGVQHSNIRFSMENGIPMWYRVPQLKSIHLSDTACNKEDLTVEEALNDPRMDGADKQQFYPYSLMRKEVIATNYQYGWLNTLTDKRGMKEYPNTPSIDNRPPYTMVFEDGSYGQVLTLEAIGGGSGVFEVYVGNGRTGEKVKFTFKNPKKGPGYAANKVVSANSERFGESKDKLTVSEVYPVFRNGELWYQVNAVQTETGIYGYTAFYNPGEDTLLKAFNDKQVTAFYRGSNQTHKQPEHIIDVPSEDQNATRSVENPSLWVVIKNDDGEGVYTVPVAENESVSVEQEQPKNSTND